MILQKNDSVERQRFGKFSYLLGSLLSLLVGIAFTGSNRISVMIFCLLFSIVLLTAVVSVCRRHKTLGVGLAFVIPMLMLNVVGYIDGGKSMFSVIHNVFIMGFFLFVSFHVLIAVLDDREVTLDTIIGAVCLYLLAGLIWAYGYSTILLMDSSAFSVKSLSPIAEYSPFSSVGLQPLIYLSFVTMATLGYGDIVPVSGPAQTACYTQAIFGQFFFAVLVARLVSIYIAPVYQRSREQTQEF